MTGDDLRGDVVHHGSLVYEGGGVERAVLQALFNDHTDSALRQAPGFHFFHLLDGYLLPMYQCSLHRQHDGAVVGYLVDGLGHDGIEDIDVPSPKLVAAFLLTND